MSVLHCFFAYLIFPGAYLHAFFEHILLKLMHIPVEDSVYMQPNELCGHIEHKPVSSFGKSLILCQCFAI